MAVARGRLATLVRIGAREGWRVVDIVTAAALKLFPQPRGQAVAFAAVPDPAAALKLLGETMMLRPHFEWRGLGFISQSALKLGDSYAAYDAEVIFDIPGVRVADPKACQCGEVLKGVLKPWECKVFGTACTPETPIGTCMVSPEGACAAYYNFGRFTRERVKEATRT